MNTMLYKSAACRQRGFTLMEVVIAITIMAITLTLAVNALHFVIKAWDKGVSKAEAVNHTSLIQDFLHRTITQAQAVMLETQDREALVAFHGERHSLRFIAPLSTKSAAGGLYIVRVAMEPHDQQTNLVLRYRRFYPDSGEFEMGQDNKVEILLENIQEAQFNYYGVKGLGEQTGWSASWKEQSRLPISVKLAVQPNDPAIKWPILVSSLKQNPRFLLRAILDQGRWIISVYPENGGCGNNYSFQLNRFHCRFG